MIVIAITLLAILLFILLLVPRRPAPPPAPLPEPSASPLTRRRNDASDGLIYGESPDGSWQGGALPDDFSPGGGDFGGGGASGEWDAGPGSDSGSDGGSDGGNSD